jgi:nicotinamidase-related amidase
MPAKNDDLHGNVPDESDVVLLLIDVVNDLEFEGGERLLEQALPMAERLAGLKARARALGIPTVYVNDNFGRWRSDLRSLVAHCLQEGVRGRAVVQRLLPDEQDYFVLKPKHSGFFSTTLDTLLTYLKASTLILAGITGDVCVLFTANDAFMRDFRLIVPADGCVSIDPQDNAYAVRQMRRALKADVTPAAELDLEALLRRTPRGPAHGKRATEGLEPQVEQHTAEPDAAEAGGASARARGG